MLNKNSQRGAVLIVSMIILLVLSLISVSAARTILLEEKMTFASRDAKTALEVAEAIILQGESYIESIETTGDFGVKNWLHLEGGGPDNLFSASSWDNTNSEVREVAMKGADGKKLKGRIYIELAGTANNMDAAEAITVDGYGNSTGAGEITVFRIVALGQGISSSTMRTVVVQYGRRF